MTDIKKQDKQTSPIAAGVAGAILGVGMAVATAVVLKDKKNQQKVKDVLSDVKDRANGYIGKVKDQVADGHKNADKKIEEGKKIIAKSVDSAKQAEKN